MALRIARDEKADAFMVEIAALLHENGDWKSGHDESEAMGQIEARLASLGVDQLVIDRVVEIIVGIPYRGSSVPDPSMGREGQCVRDADRLDAIGAIGIARTFAYGGSTGRPIYDPDVPPVRNVTEVEYRSRQGTTANHFSEKLLLLRERMETKLGRALADHRHQVMVQFLEELKKEWNGVS